MKRIISLCCVALVCFFSLAAPARADDPGSNFLDVLQYGSIKSITDGTFEGLYFQTDSASTKISFSNPSTGDYNYLDMVVSWAYTTSLQSVSFGREFQQYGLSISHINGTLYRVYGKVTTQRIDDLFLTFNCSGGATSYCTIYSLRLGLVGYDFMDIEAYCAISATDYSQTIHYVPTDEINHRVIISAADFSDTAFNCFIHTDSWRDFDYVDFQFYFECANITSISAVFGASYIPLEYSLVEASNVEGDGFYVSMRLDLTGLDRSSSDYPMIVLMGRFEYHAANLISFMNCSGHITRNYTNPLSFYFSQLKLWINSLGDRIVAAVEGDKSSANEFQNSLNQELDELDQAQAVMDSVTKPSIEQIDVSVDDFVTDTDIQVLATPLSIFFQGEIFSKIIIMSILLATVSYTLFGKK